MLELILTVPELRAYSIRQIKRIGYVCYEARVVFGLDPTVVMGTHEVVSILRIESKPLVTGHTSASKVQVIERSVRTVQIC